MHPTPNYPDSDSVADALLLLIYQIGGRDHVVRASDTYEVLADQFHLGLVERNLTLGECNGGESTGKKWDNNVQWARNDLRKAGHLARFAHGWWQLSEQGVRIAEARLKRGL